jgi:hypothetical protein
MNRLMLFNLSSFAQQTMAGPERTHRGLQNHLLSCERQSGSKIALLNLASHETGICLEMWHAECYRPKGSVRSYSDLDDAVLGSEQLRSTDPDRFRRARDGDHLLSVSV